jgi:hypothetical protein
MKMKTPFEVTLDYIVRSCLKKERERRKERKRGEGRKKRRKEGKKEEKKKGKKRK